MPNIFSNVQKSKGTTAIAAMDGIKNSLEQCAYQSNAAPKTNAVGGSCTTSAYGLTSSNGFTFDIASTAFTLDKPDSGCTVVASGTPAGGNLTYSITATDNGSNDVISLTRATNGIFYCSAPSEGVYANLCVSSICPSGSSDGG